MAKVVKRQALRVAGKPVKKASTEEATDVKAPVKKIQKADAQSESKKAAKDALKATRTKEAQAKIDSCGYKIGDEVMMKSGRIVKLTKMTVRPNGVHLWWETAKGPSAGGDYTSRVRGKMVDGKCIDPITGKAVETPAPKKAKAPKKDKAPKVESSNSVVAEIPEEKVFENEAGDGFELEDGTPCNEDGSPIGE